MTLYVDADACPVRSEAEAVATRYNVPTILVCNGGIRPSANPLVSVKYVSEGLDQADKWIAQEAGPNDVVITADIPLAAECVSGGAIVIKPDGEKLTERNIGNILATRNLMADLRSADPFRQGGAKPYGKADRSRFSQSLDQALKELIRWSQTSKT